MNVALPPPPVVAVVVPLSVPPPKRSGRHDHSGLTHGVAQIVLQLNHRLLRQGRSALSRGRGGRADPQHGGGPSLGRRREGDRRESADRGIERVVSRHCAEGPARDLRDSAETRRNAATRDTPSTGRNGESHGRADDRIATPSNTWTLGRLDTGCPTVPPRIVEVVATMLAGVPPVRR